MILSVSFALLAAVALTWRKYRRPLVAAWAVLVWLVASGWLAAPLVALAEYGVRPIAHPVMRGHTVLIVIGAGTRKRGDRVTPPVDGLARIAKATALYSSCKRIADACTVVVSGGDPQHHGATEAQTYGREFITNGVARDDLIIENRSQTTYENAKFTASILRSTPYDEAILVTSSYQMRRALLDFARFGVTPQPVYANRVEAQTGWRPRIVNLIAAERALHEIVGIAQFRVYRALGWF